jgi:hypothetical protein
VVVGSRKDGFMTEFKNAMEIFTLLDKSNCKKCLMPTCLAFAGAVFTGQKKLGECPNLSRDLVTRLEGKAPSVSGFEQIINDLMAQLAQEIQALDLEKAAKTIGEEFSGGKLTMKILGKNFSIDKSGAISTEIHINPWVAIPAYKYILKGAKHEITGIWVPFRELPEGKEGERLFSQRCEKPIKKLADAHTDLFDDIIHLFSGRQVENYYDSDISIVLKPLPKIPMLICYWKADAEMDSDLKIFFDAATKENLDTDSVNSLITGFSRMLEKIAFQHR